MISQESNIVNPESHNVIDKELFELLPISSSPEKHSYPFQNPKTPMKISPITSPNITVAKNLAPIFDEIYRKSSPKPKPTDELPDLEDAHRIYYQGRNILDLDSNIKCKWLFQPSRNPHSINFFKFSEVNNHYTVVRRMRDKVDGEYYYCYPLAEDMTRF